MRVINLNFNVPLNVLYQEFVSSPLFASLVIDYSVDDLMAFYLNNLVSNEYTSDEDLALSLVEVVFGYHEDEALLSLSRVYTTMSEVVKRTIRSDNGWVFSTVKIMNINQNTRQFSASAIMLGAGEELRRNSGRQVESCIPTE